MVTSALALPASNGQHLHLARTLILTGLVGFGFFVAVESGTLGAALESDRSYLSYVILVVYGGASVMWLLHSRRLSLERDRLAVLEAALKRGERPVLRPEGAVALGDDVWEEGDLSSHLGSVLSKRRTRPDAGTDVLLGSLTDTIANRHAAGHFVSDALLRLGLLGTIVGFILMLGPVAEMDSFDPAAARAMLQDMSGGMAVALYTTLSGLVTSILLKLQYQFLDTAAQDFVNRVAVLTDVHLGTPMTPPAETA